MRSQSRKIIIIKEVGFPGGMAHLSVELSPLSLRCSETPWRKVWVTIANATGSTGEKQGWLSVSGVFFCSAEAMLVHMICQGEGAYQEKRGPEGGLCVQTRRGRAAGSLPVRGRHTNMWRSRAHAGPGQWELGEAESKILMRIPSFTVWYYPLFSLQWFQWLAGTILDYEP